MPLGQRCSNEVVEHGVQAGAERSESVPWQLKHYDVTHFRPLFGMNKSGEVRVPVFWTPSRSSSRVGRISLNEALQRRSDRCSTRLNVLASTQRQGGGGFARLGFR